MECALREFIVDRVNVKIDSKILIGLFKILSVVVVWNVIYENPSTFPYICECEYVSWTFIKSIGIWVYERNYAENTEQMNSINVN